MTTAAGHLVYLRALTSPNAKHRHVNAELWPADSPEQKKTRENVLAKHPLTPEHMHLGMSDLMQLFPPPVVPESAP